MVLQEWEACTITVPQVLQQPMVVLWASLPQLAPLVFWGASPSKRDSQQWVAQERRRLREPCLLALLLERLAVCMASRHLLLDLLGRLPILMLLATRLLLVQVQLASLQVQPLASPLVWHRAWPMQTQPCSTGSSRTKCPSLMGVRWGMVHMERTARLLLHNSVRPEGLLLKVDLGTSRSWPRTPQLARVGLVDMARVEGTMTMGRATEVLVVEVVRGARAVMVSMEGTVATVDTQVGAMAATAGVTTRGGTAAGTIIMVAMEAMVDMVVTDTQAEDNFKASTPALRVAMEGTAASQDMGWGTVSTTPTSVERGGTVPVLAPWTPTVWPSRVALEGEVGEGTVAFPRMTTGVSEGARASLKVAPVGGMAAVPVAGACSSSSRVGPGGRRDGDPPRGRRVGHRVASSHLACSQMFRTRLQRLELAGLDRTGEAQAGRVAKYCR